MVAELGMPFKQPAAHLTPSAACSHRHSWHPCGTVFSHHPSLCTWLVSAFRTVSCCNYHYYFLPPPLPSRHISCKLREEGGREEGREVPEVDKSAAGRGAMPTPQCTPSEQEQNEGKQKYKCPCGDKTVTLCGGQEPVVP